MSILILMATAALSTWNHQQLVSTQHDVAETQQLLSQINELHFAILEAQNSQRGYLITTQEVFVDTFRRATNGLPRLLAALRQHFKENASQENASQQARLVRLASTFTQILSLSGEHIAQRRRGDSATTVPAGSQEGMTLMSSIQGLLEEMAGEERRQLADRQTASARAERVAFWFNNSGRVLSIVLFAGVFFALLRENSLRQQTELALRRAGSELEQRVQERTAELNEKNKELETIVYIVSHDLRSPLVNVQGFSRRLGRACDKLKQLVAANPKGAVPTDALQAVIGESIPQAIGFIESGVTRMDQLLSGFLRYSRLGRVALNVGPLAMNELLTGVLKGMEFQVSQAKAELRIDPLPACLGDATHTPQVFANLIDNALKYRDPARPLRVTVTGRIEDGRCVYCVSDTGIGIAPEHQSKVFEIFHRLTPDSGAPGEGLGLTIAQRILERQHGRIWLESQPGVGTTFFVALPRAPQTAEKLAL